MDLWSSCAVARRRRRLFARRDRDAAVRRGISRRSRRRWVACHPNAGLPNALGLHDGGPSRPLDRRVRARRPCQHRRRLLQHDARARAAGSSRPVDGVAPRVRYRAGRRATRFRGVEPFELRHDAGCDPRRSESASGSTSPAPPSVTSARQRASKMQKALDVCDRAGARRREPPRREHGRRPP